MLVPAQEMSDKPAGPVILARKNAQPTILLPFSAKKCLIIGQSNGMMLYRN
jgi:hypothetical protein